MLKVLFVSILEVERVNLIKYEMLEYAATEIVLNFFFSKLDV